MVDDRMDSHVRKHDADVTAIYKIMDERNQLLHEELRDIKLELKALRSDLQGR